MYVRIARFEGALSDWEERADELRRRIADTQEDERPPIVRVMMLFDEQTGRGAGLQFCESEDDLAEVDEFMNAQLVLPGAGKRVGVEHYRVVFDVAPAEVRAQV